MNNRVRIQHYIPQFYLKQFSKEMNAKYPIYCFDKKKLTVISTVVKKIGCEKFFYQYAYEKKQFFEQALQKLEISFSKSVKKLVEKRNLESLTFKEKRFVSLFIAVQDLRTKEQREMMREYIATVYALGFTKSNFEKTKNIIQNSMEEKYLQKKQMELILQYSPLYAQILMTMDWCLFENLNTNVFWTSDHPIVRHNDMKDVFGIRDTSLTNPNLQIHVPLSPSLSLCVFQINQPVKLNHFVVSERNVTFLNELQVLNSRRFIFSIDNNFSLIRRMINKNPELAKINQEKYKIRKI